MLRRLLWRADRICRARDEGEGNETGKQGNVETNLAKPSEGNEASKETKGWLKVRNKSLFSRFPERKKVYPIR
jgi:hypothetical protein